MATKQQVIETIQQGIQRVEDTFGGLTDDQLDTVVYDDEHGWTARQVLAHLASRGETYAMLFQMATIQPPVTTGFDVNQWNQQQVDARAGMTAQQLLTAFRAVHAELIEAIEALPETELQRTVSLPHGDLAVSDLVLASGGLHSARHAEEVVRGLGLGDRG